MASPVTNADFPVIQTPLIDSQGHMTVPFYRYFHDFGQSAGNSSTDLQEQITKIATDLGSPDGTVDNIPPISLGGFLPTSTTIKGNGSIGVQGALAQGVVTISLAYDSDNPPPTSYYGAGSSGNRGWFPVSSAILPSSNVTISIASNGVSTFDLSSTSVSAGTYGDASHIPVFTVDLKGRLTSASSVAVVTSGEILVADGVSSPPVMLTDEAEDDFLYQG